MINSVLVYTIEDIIRYGLLAILIIIVLIIGICKVISNIGNKITKRMWKDKDENKKDRTI